MCIHEAGHALCYGLCNGIPEDATIGIDADAFNLAMGIVTLPKPRDPTEVTKRLLEWQMLMLMSGAAAERHFLGEDSVCRGGDMTAMSATATLYLIAGYGEVYLPDATEEKEIAANRGVIYRLREEFSAKADLLIQRNTERCRKFADDISRLEYLGSEEIASMVTDIDDPWNEPLLCWPESIALFSPHTAAIK